MASLRRGYGMGGEQGCGGRQVASDGAVPGAVWQGGWVLLPHSAWVRA